MTAIQLFNIFNQPLNDQVATCNGYTPKIKQVEYMVNFRNDYASIHFLQIAAR